MHDGSALHMLDAYITSYEQSRGASSVHRETDSSAQRVIGRHKDTSFASSSGRRSSEPISTPALFAREESNAAGRASGSLETDLFACLSALEQRRVIRAHQQQSLLHSLLSDIDWDDRCDESEAGLLPAKDSISEEDFQAILLGEERVAAHPSRQLFAPQDSAPQSQGEDAALSRARRSFRQLASGVDGVFLSTPLPALAAKSERGDLKQHKEERLAKPCLSPHDELALYIDSHATRSDLRKGKREMEESTIVPPSPRQASDRSILFSDSNLPPQSLTSFSFKSPEPKTPLNPPLFT